MRKKRLTYRRDSDTLTTAPPRGEPVLSAADKAAIHEIYTNPAFRLDPSVNLYTDVARLRPRK